MSVFGILEERTAGSHAECGTLVMSPDGLRKLIVWLLIAVSHTCK